MTIDNAIELMIQGSKYNYDGSAEDFCEAYNMSIEIMRKYQKIEKVLDKIRTEIEIRLKGVNITLETLVEDDTLIPIMRGAKTTLKEVLDIIDEVIKEVSA